VRAAGKIADVGSGKRTTCLWGKDTVNLYAGLLLLDDFWGEDDLSEALRAVQLGLHDWWRDAVLFTSSIDANFGKMALISVPHFLKVVASFLRLFSARLYSSRVTLLICSL